MDCGTARPVQWWVDAMSICLREDWIPSGRDRMHAIIGTRRSPEPESEVARVQQFRTDIEALRPASVLLID